MAAHQRVKRASTRLTSFPFGAGVPVFTALMVAVIGRGI